MISEVLNAVGQPGPSAPEVAPLDPSSRLIIDEARSRGITVEILAPRAEYYRLRLGDRVVTCRESLSDRTNAVALSYCDDKRVTARLLAEAGLRVPVQQRAGSAADNEAFLRTHGNIVVKPARGEQGKGVCVGTQTVEAMARAIDHARKVDASVVLEELVAGDDLRVIVIDDEVVVAAVRRPPRGTGDGIQPVRALIEAHSARRARETFGESEIPMDGETERCVRDAGFGMDDVLPAGTTVTVRKAANLHTGGSIEDVTDQLHVSLREVARQAARALQMPVVGLDLMVPDVRASTYWIIEANERPGFAHHEPHPVAQRFVDFLFPETRHDR